MKFMPFPLLVFGLILIIYACSKKELLTNKSQDESIQLELSQDKNFQFIISNAPKRREELSKIYTSVLSQKINKVSKTKAAVSIAKYESGQLASLLANNIIIKNYNTHLAELRKAYPDLFVKMTKAEFMIRVYPAIKLYRQKAVDNLGVSKVSSIAETDSCMTQCDVDYQPDYDYAQFMYDDQSSFCYDPPCGQPGDPNYNTCMDEQNACIDEAWLYWMWNHWNSIDQQVTQCKMDCENIYGYPGVTLNNGMLEFVTMVEYDAFIDRLENKYETHSAAFYDQYDHLTDDQVDSISTAQNFDDLKPYRDFETYFGFSSLRAKIEGQVNTWENNPTSPYPESDYLCADESEQALLNQYGKVKIAGEILNLGNYAETYGVGTCEQEYKRDAWVSPNSNIKIYQEIAGKGYTGQRLRVLVKSRKASNSKRLAIKLNVRSFGYAYTSNCTGDTPFDSGWKHPTDKRRRRMAKRFHRPQPQINCGNCSLDHFKRNYVTGEFKTQGILSTLVWQ